MNDINTSDAIYLVDLENIGHKILYQYVENHQNTQYIVFYSENTVSPETILEHIPVSVQVTFIDCKTGANNAMDFCICAMAGQLSADSGKQIAILSDDKGYDAMLHMLSTQGIRISRKSTGQSEPAKKKTKEKNSSKTKNKQNDQSLAAAIRKNVPKQYQENLIIAMSKVTNKSDAHEVCQAILPQKMVSDIYGKLKKYIPKEVI